MARSAACGPPRRPWSSRSPAQLHCAGHRRPATLAQGGHGGDHRCQRRRHHLGRSVRSGQSRDQLDETAAPVRVNDAVNGMPALRFATAPQYLDVASSPSVALAGDLTTFAVLKATTSPPSAGLGQDRRNRAEPNDYYLAAGTGIATLYRADTAPRPPRASPAPSPCRPARLLWSASTSPVRRDPLPERPGRPDREHHAGPEDGGAPLRIGARDDLVTQMKVIWRSC